LTVDTRYLTKTLYQHTKKGKSTEL
jgi:hypothetical protein